MVDMKGILGLSEKAAGEPSRASCHVESSHSFAPAHDDSSSHQDDSGWITTRLASLVSAHRVQISSMYTDGSVAVGSV